MVARVGLWRHPDHYDWLSGYLHARGWGFGTRVALSFISASMTLNMVALWASPDSPRGPVPVAMTVAAFAGGMAAAVLWAWRWPSRSQSIIFVMVSTASVALTCLAVANPLAALIGCIGFAMVGAYAAFFHTTGFVVYNFLVAAAVGSFEAIRVAASGHTALGMMDLWLVLAVNIALPVAIGFLVRALGVDLLGADRDPLTGVSNRRSFRRNVQGLIAARRPQDNYLVAVVIDLDNFKGINDAFGHAAGDETLVHVAQALQSTAGAGAVVGRSGGEEFVVADTMSASDPTSLAQRICDAIADLPDPVTASVGTACAPLNDIDDGMHRPLIKHLIDAADAAMYRAKRSGGNRFHHHGLYSPGREGTTISAEE